MRHLHFVQATDATRGGGLGPASVGLHQSLRQIKSASRLLTTSSAGEAPQSESIEAFERSGPSQLFYAPGLRAAALEALREVDVVHGHGFYVYGNAVIPRAARSVRVPLVYHPHGMLEPWALDRSRGRKQLARWLFENRNFDSTALWRALTGREADQIRKLGVSAPIVVVPNGVSTAEFAQADVIRSRTREGAERLLFLGRIHPVKGLENLIHAWSIVRQDFPGSQLTIAGPDQIGYTFVLKGLARELELRSSVAFVGPVSRAELPELFGSSDLFVLPSHSEGFPLVALEAMASGLPVVATSSTNLDRLELSGAGFLCENTLKELVYALRTALSLRTPDRVRMGAAGRAWMNREFAWPDIAREVDEGCRLIV